MAGFIDNDELNSLKGTVTTTIKEVVKEKPKKIIYKEFDYDELVHMDKTIHLEESNEFTEDIYPYSLNFYDFEVFMGDWMVVIINPIECVKKIIVNNPEALKKYYKQHKNQIWVGYNSRSYDTFILKSILLGLNPKKVNDMIIVYGMKGYQIDDRFREIKFLNFDIFTGLNSLKTLEGFMGNDIRETSVPFDIERPLTKDEILLTVKYCMHDVEQTIEVFKRRKNLYDSQIDLINTFELPIDMVSLTQAQLSANIMKCHKMDFDDEFDLEIVDCLKIKKYKEVLDWFNNPRNRNYKSELEIDVAGVPHKFAWGGLHGCPEEPIHRKGKIFHVDVTSYYPSLMIEYGFLSRTCENPKKFKQIYDKRVELKKAGKKKEQAPYKIVLNGFYGINKDPYSKAHDPRQANNVCVNGQLMLLDLLEHLEGHAEIIQSNTDGIILQVEDNEKSIQTMKDICQEWMDRTRMGLGFDEIDEIWQGDVNNYIFRFTSGKLERKGAYVMELDDLSYDLPIVNESIVKFLTEGIKPKETVNNCKELKEFQKVVKISSNYSFGWHNGEYLTDKTFRVFASKNNKDGSIFKCKYPMGSMIENPDGSTRKYMGEKFANTPEHCFIYNDDVNNVEIPDYLDKKYYIQLAEDRIEDKFGISMSENEVLF